MKTAKQRKKDLQSIGKKMIKQIADLKKSTKECKAALDDIPATMRQELQEDPDLTELFEECVASFEEINT